MAEVAGLVVGVEESPLAVAAQLDPLDGRPAAVNRDQHPVAAGGIERSDGDPAAGHLRGGLGRCGGRRLRLGLLRRLFFPLGVVGRCVFSGLLLASVVRLLALVFVFLWILLAVLLGDLLLGGRSEPDPQAEMRPQDQNHQDDEQDVAAFHGRRALGERVRSGKSITLSPVVHDRNRPPVRATSYLPSLSRSARNGSSWLIE